MNNFKTAYQMPPYKHGIVGEFVVEGNEGKVTLRKVELELNATGPMRFRVAHQWRNKEGRKQSKFYEFSTSAGGGEWNAPNIEMKPGSRMTISIASHANLQGAQLTFFYDEEKANVVPQGKVVKPKVKKQEPTAQKSSTPVDNAKHPAPSKK